MMRMIALMTLTLALAACGKPISGKITLTGDRSIPIITEEGTTAELGAGSATVQIKSAFSPKLEIRTSHQAVSVKVPKKILANKKDFYLPAEKIKQPVDLEALTRYELISRHEEVGSQTCFTGGMCYDPCRTYSNAPGCYYNPGYPYQPGYPGHPYPPHPGYQPYPGYPGGYGWHSNCPGVVTIKSVYETQREIFSIGFREPSDKALLGYFEGERGIRTELVDSIPLSACQLL